MPQSDRDVVDAVTQTLHLYDHLVDNGEWEQLGAILAPEFELTAPDGVFRGAAGARSFEEGAGEHLPAHHVLNTLVEPVPGRDAVRAWSRYLLVTWDYAARVGDYLDLLVPDGEDWQLVARQVLPRGAGGEPRAEHASFAAWRAVGA